MEALGPYAYQSLPQAESFRVLELLPGEEDEELFTKLHIADLRISPPFEALSYFWGHSKARVPISCNGRVLRITSNLRDALRRSRRRDSSRFIWADAVCINQEGNLEEKSKHISYMRKIYSKAIRVVVWLGLDDNGQAATAAHAMNEIARSVCNAKSISVSELWEIDYLKTVVLDSVSWKALSCNTAETWHSLLWFFSGPWFERIWVYQEVKSGPKVLCHCGDIELDMDIVGLTAEYITVYRDLFDIYEFGRSHIWCAVEHRDRTILNDSCLDLLNAARGLKATLPVDKVYGLLGMPSFSDVSLRLRANYEKPVAEVYQDMADVALDHLRNLDLLAYVQHDRNISHDLPSWVPRWDQAKYRHPILRSSRLHGAYNTSQGLHFTYERDPKDTVLKVPGIWFDTITTERGIDCEEEFFPRDRPLDPHPILEFWLESEAEPSFYPTGEPSIDVYPSVLTLGSTTKSNQTEQEPVHQQADFSAYIIQLMESSQRSISEYKSLQERGKYGNATSWASEARNTTWGHSFFTTKKGYMGLGSQAMRVGDVVTILAGSEVPLILRQAGEIFHLVGESYVHGIMNGEAVQHSARMETLKIQ